VEAKTGLIARGAFVLTSSDGQRGYEVERLEWELESQTGVLETGVSQVETSWIGNWRFIRAYNGEARGS
jgi:hypothetical protein